MENNKVFYSVNEVSRMIGCSPNRLYMLIEENLIPATRLRPTSRWLIPADSLSAWLGSKAEEATARLQGDTVSEGVQDAVA